jgi:predicted HTH domain antitoxin
VETIAVTVEMPKSLLAVANVREEELQTLVREAIAVDLYRRGHLSIGKAAEVAGVPTKWEMLMVLARHDVWIDYSAEDAQIDATAVANVLRS